MHFHVLFLYFFQIEQIKLIQRKQITYLKINNYYIKVHPCTHLSHKNRKQDVYDLPSNGLDWWYGPSLLNNHWARWPKLYNILFSCCGDPDPRPCCLRSRWRRSRRTWRSTATSSTLRIRWDKVKQVKSWWVNYLFIRIKKVFSHFSLTK